MTSMWKKTGIPVRIGLAFAALGIILVIVGILRGNVPMNPASMAVALLIGGGMWFLVSWAVATAAMDVEADMAASTEDVDEQ